MVLAISMLMAPAPRLLSKPWSSPIGLTRLEAPLDHVLGLLMSQRQTGKVSVRSEVPLTVRRATSLGCERSRIAPFFDPWGLSGRIDIRLLFE